MIFQKREESESVEDLIINRTHSSSALTNNKILNQIFEGVLTAHLATEYSSSSNGQLLSFGLSFSTQGFHVCDYIDNARLYVNEEFKTPQSSSGTPGHSKANNSNCMFLNT